MAASYPGAVKTFTTKINKVDLVDASHMNDVQNEIVAIENELGTDVAGSAATLKARLAICLGDTGAVQKGTGFPGSPIEGQLFYRTDEDVLYIYDGSDWDAISYTSKIQLFTGNGNFTAPPGVTKVYITMVGGGGGGAGGSAGDTPGGGGGGGAGIIKIPYTVVPASVYAVVVGAGGAGGAVNTQGVDGGASTFNSVLTALGGTKGTVGGGGAGGVSSMTTTVAAGGIPGFAGGTGANQNAVNYGGGGGGSIIGVGGIGGPNGQAGTAPAYGHGGGGGGGGSNAAGGAGTVGCVIVEWA